MDNFTLAELYHQKYYLQSNKFLMDEFLNSSSAVEDIIDSTTAARINGYIAGYGNSEDLKAEIDSYGLSEAGKQYLLKRVKQ